jgi:hypothetical protein
VPARVSRSVDRPQPARDLQDIPVAVRLYLPDGRRLRAAVADRVRHVAHHPRAPQALRHAAGERHPPAPHPSRVTLRREHRGAGLDPDPLRAPTLSGW